MRVVTKYWIYCGQQILTKCSGRRAVGSRAPVPVRFNSGSFYSSFCRTRVMPRASHGKELTANSSWPIPTRWRDDGARGSLSLIWITTNCRGLWGESLRWWLRVSPAGTLAFTIATRRVFLQTSNGKAINEPSFMFWRSFGEKVNSFDIYMCTVGCSTRARVCVGVVGFEREGGGERGRNFNHRQSNRR